MLRRFIPDATLKCGPFARRHGSVSVKSNCSSSEPKYMFSCVNRWFATPPGWFSSIPNQLKCQFSFSRDRRIAGFRCYMKLFTQIQNDSHRANAMYNFVQLVLSVCVWEASMWSLRTNSSPLITLEIDLYWYITFSRLPTPSRVSGNHSYCAWEQFGV